nr:hypothetical protein [Tanacetum cinerariifolium]
MMSYQKIVSTYKGGKAILTSLQVLRRLESIFTSVYAAKVYKAGKRLLYAKRNKAISLGKGAYNVSREVHLPFFKGLYLDFHDSPDDEDDTRSSHEYLKYLEEEYQAKRVLKGLAVQKQLAKLNAINMARKDKKRYHRMMKKLKSKLSWHLLKKKENLLAKKALETLTEDTSSFRLKDLVFIKSSADNADMSIASSNLHKSSQAEDSTLPNHDTDEVPLNTSQRNTTDPLVVVSDSLVLDYDSADESSVCSTPLLPLKKLDRAEPRSGPKTVKSILKSKSTFKAETLKGITLNEPSLAPARGNESSLVSKTNSAPAGKLKNVNVEYHPPLAMICMSTCGFVAFTGAQLPVNTRTTKNGLTHFSLVYKMILSNSSAVSRVKSPNMYREYLAEFWYSAQALENSKVSFSIPTGKISGVVGVNTFKNAIGAHYLPYSSEYVASPSIDIVRQWFATIGYGEEVLAKGNLKKSLLPPR